MDCADFQADRSVRLNVGGRGARRYTAPATQFPVRMLVSLYCNRVARLRAGTRPGPFTRAKAALVQDDNAQVLTRLSRALSKLRHERDARAYITRLGGRGRPPLRGLCRFPGGQECAPQCWRARRPRHTAPATQLQVRMLVSRRIAITFRDCARGLAQVPHSRKSGARSG